MSTRFYLPSTGAAAVSPAYEAGWDTAPGGRLKLVQTKISSAMTSVNHSTSGTTHGTRQYVSDPLPAQTISGTVKCYLRAFEDSAGDTYTSYLSIRVCNEAGTAFRGTLLALGHHGPGTDFATSATNRIFADGDTLSSLAINANDRLVIEIGTAESGTASNNSKVVIGDDSGTDLPEDETETAAYNPWIEFSADLFSLKQTVADTLALADALAMKMGKVLTESATLAEAFALKTGKVLTDAASLADAVSAVLVRTVSVADTLAILDALSLKLGKVISEAATLADTTQALLVRLPSIQTRYAPRPLITLTIGAATKRYSTETLAVPAAGQVGVAQVGESQVGG